MKYLANSLVVGGQVMKNILWPVSLCCLLAGNAGASGFIVPEQSPKAMGMGNAFAAMADDASANWYNPAGLAFQENTVSVNSTLIYPLNDYEQGGQTYSAKKGTHVVPQLYARYGSVGSKISYGLGVNAPFGLSTDWSQSGAPFSKVAAGADSITFSEIQAVHVNPNIAWQVNDHFSVAAGVAYYNAFKVHLDGQSLKVGGSGDGFGGNLALLYKAEAFSVGAGYRSQVKLSITGTAVGGPGMALFGLEGIGANASTSVTLPDLFTAAVSFKPKENLVLNAQAERINWATFDKIVINYDPSLLNMATGSSTTVQENWKATVVYRLGAQWSYSDTSRARMGYTYDPTPINTTDFSPRLPGNDRQLLSLGYGTDVTDAMTVDIAYAYVWLDNRTATAPTNSLYHGVYKSKAHLAAAGLSYRF